MAPFFYRHKRYKIKEGDIYEGLRTYKQIIEPKRFRTKNVTAKIAGAQMYYQYSEKNYGDRMYAFSFATDFEPFKAGDMIFLSQRAIEEIPDERKEKTGIVFMDLPEI